MDAKRALTTGVFCPMPFKGLMYNFDGKVKNCIRSSGKIGDLKENSINEILNGEVNRHTQSCMLNDKPGPNCAPCYDLEKGKRGFDIISDRIFYIKELKNEPFVDYQEGIMVYELLMFDGLICVILLVCIVVVNLVANGQANLNSSALLQTKLNCKNSKIISFQMLLN